MSKLSPPKIVSPAKIALFISLGLAVLVAGCSHHKTNRGHLLRGDWAVEYNRTPWIGTSPDAEPTYQEVADESKSRKTLFDCLSKDGNEKKQGLRRHCGMKKDCTPKNPCCRTLGCGMWVDPNDPAMPSSHGGAARACGLTPFCFPEKPCGLTPGCGKPGNGAMNVNVNANPQTLVMPNGQVVNNMAVNGMPTMRGMSPGTVPGTLVPGTLVSRGIVPGASRITSGGMVAAIGVATPAGTMTPLGIRLPNGMVNNNIVLRACVMTPNCTAAHPCGLTPACGGAVAVNVVANNAVALASALQAQGVAGGVMQAGGMGTLVNPMTNQPISGLTMSGYPQVGYPPIGYAPMGYAPGYPRYAAGMVDTGEAEQEAPDDEEEETVVPPETRSAMPVPRFHPVPSKPAFQRNEGMMPTPDAQRTTAKPPTTALTEQRGVSGQEIEAALDRAYLEGVSAAMNEVERKLEAKRQAAAKVKLQERILRQADYLQQQLDEQEQLQVLAMQRAKRERQLRQQAAQQVAVPANAVSATAEPVLVRTVSQPPQLQRPPQPTGHQEPPSPLQLAESLKSSVVGKVNAAFSLLDAKPEQVTAATKPLPLSPRAAPSDTPIKPPVATSSMKHGLLPEPSEEGVVQAQFTADDVSIAP